MTDTPQQKRVLRTNATARKVRARFPVGTVVVADLGDGKRGPVRGEVQRHVPGTNAQGGYLVVKWEGGTVGRHSPISLAVVEDA